MEMSLLNSSKLQKVDKDIEKDKSDKKCETSFEQVCLHIQKSSIQINFMFIVEVSFIMLALKNFDIATG